MSNNLIKGIVFSFVEPLTYCINLLLNEGVFPEPLKISRVCPIHKKGPKNEPSSFRPVSIIPILSKLIEIVVYEQISSFFESNNILNNCQYGFRVNRSTVDALDSLIRPIYKAFEDKELAQITCCDLSQAFPCVDHSDLLLKLNFYGVSGSPLKFFKSYLENRKQKVLINHKWSEEALVEGGVPQGSILGPFLFLISINDLPLSVKSKTLLYADDTTFVNVSSNLNELEELASNTLKDASDWFSANGFLLNENKTQNMIFHLKSDLNFFKEDLQSSVKFLGVFADRELNWHAC